MTDRPIIFSAPMVRALLDGRKSQTRRLIKPQPYTVEGVVFTWEGPKSAFLCGPQAIASNLRDHGAIRYAPGDRLYVREAFSYDRLDVDRDGTLPPWYWADGNPSSGDWSRPKPSIFCPRWASRITLTVTEVRVQRLQEISEADAVAEGIWLHTLAGLSGWRDYATVDCMVKRYFSDPRQSYASLWNSLHGPDAWGDNPWVVAVSFSVRQRNIDAA